MLDEPDVLNFGNGVQVHLNHIRESLHDGAYLYGPLASFCIKHYIPEVLHSADWANRDKVYFHDSDVYEFIMRRCSTPDSKNGILGEKTAPLFAWRRKSLEMPPFFRKLLDYEVSIIPIHWVDHWFLAILQWLSRDEKNPFTARIIIMDSKFDDQECKEILTIAANTVHSHFRIAMREALAMAGKQRELQELRLVW
ncbi:hypothetical protein KIN20_008656 [Parelaphostrongylus tenuis]|uniref:Uncharacterized protein n=1 Tax=Parelaphostrongylus tenuis TaxID=148309 RepID=A0AAD5MRE3_PARTN|nr:hypothetical protein KIN20_008656 [Parelaphostrongylus tenuis]